MFEPENQTDSSQEMTTPTIKVTVGENVSIHRYMQADLERVRIAPTGDVLEVRLDDSFASGVAVKIREEFGMEFEIDQGWIDVGRDRSRQE